MKVRKNGRVQTKDRNLSQVLDEARNSLRLGVKYEILLDDSWVQAVHERNYGIVEFSNGSFLDNLDCDFNDNPTWS